MKTLTERLDDLYWELAPDGGLHTVRLGYEYRISVVEEVIRVERWLFGKHGVVEKRNVSRTAQNYETVIAFATAVSQGKHPALPDSDQDTGAGATAGA